MLTYNLDTSDGLTNGAIGEVIGYDMSPEGRIQKIYVHFYDEKEENNSQSFSKGFQASYPHL